MASLQDVRETCALKYYKGAGDLARLLRALVALAKDQVQVPVPTLWLTIGNCSSRESMPSSVPPPSADMVHKHKNLQTKH